MNHFICSEFQLEDGIKVKLKYELNLSSEELSLVEFLENSLIQIYHLNQFLAAYNFKWSPAPQTLYRKARIYLHKIHRVAPIFDYDRAKVNLASLQKLFFRSGFCPHLTTQLALTIFITDLKSEEREEESFKPIIQRNIRMITSCSAYAFHYSRNKINKMLNTDF